VNGREGATPCQSRAGTPCVVGGCCRSGYHSLPPLGATPGTDAGRASTIWHVALILLLDVTSNMMYTYSIMSHSKWHVIYYEDALKRSNVFDFIEGRKDREKAKILAMLAVLEEQGHQLPRPYADLLIDGIHELRVKLSGDQIRILYFFCYRDFIILTNVFTKTTQKVPVNEIQKARKLRSDFLQRNSEQALRRTIHEDS
jgi:hypothetical protein